MIVIVNRILSNVDTAEDYMKNMSAAMASQSIGLEINPETLSADVDNILSDGDSILIW